MKFIIALLLIFFFLCSSGKKYYKFNVTSKKNKLLTRKGLNSIRVKNKLEISFDYSSTQFDKETLFSIENFIDLWAEKKIVYANIITSSGYHKLQLPPGIHEKISFTYDKSKITLCNKKECVDKTFPFSNDLSTWQIPDEIKSKKSSNIRNFRFQDEYSSDFSAITPMSGNICKKKNNICRKFFGYENKNENNVYVAKPYSSRFNDDINTCSYDKLVLVAYPNIDTKTAEGTNWWQLIFDENKFRDCCSVYASISFKTKTLTVNEIYVQFENCKTSIILPDDVNSISVNIMNGKKKIDLKLKSPVTSQLRRKNIESINLNIFYPTTESSNVPSVFKPGIHKNAFFIDMPCENNIFWSIGNKLLTSVYNPAINYPDCTSFSADIKAQCDLNDHHHHHHDDKCFEDIHRGDCNAVEITGWEEKCIDEEDTYTGYIAYSVDNHGLLYLNDELLDSNDDWRTSRKVYLNLTCGDKIKIVGTNEGEYSEQNPGSFYY